MCSRVQGVVDAVFVGEYEESVEDRVPVTSIAEDVEFTGVEYCGMLMV